jgi:dihydroxyacetone kinase
MADAAVAGQVFAAPNPFSIQATAEASGESDGTIYIYGNYSGDVLNFNFAVEEAEDAGKKAAEIRVHDDIASVPVDRLEARRGIAGDIFVIKCTCAAADRGDSYDEVLKVGERVNQRTRSLGVALSAASSMENGLPMFDLPLGSIELGMGLHGEMGVQRSEFQPADVLVPRMLELLLRDYEATGAKPDRAAVMINGLGGTTVLELLVVSGLVKNGLDQAGVKTGLFVTGEFATSLDMAGFSITLLHLDDEIESLLKAPAESFCFSQSA